MASKTGGTSYHICVGVERAMEELIKGNNFFNVSSDKAFSALVRQQKAGKPWFTGCSREDKTGRCRGHKIKPV